MSDLEPRISTMIDADVQCACTRTHSAIWDFCPFLDTVENDEWVCAIDPLELHIEHVEPGSCLFVCQVLFNSAAAHI